MNIFSLVIAILTSILLICSVLFFPSIKIKGKQIKLYWIICLIGALILIISKAIPFTILKDELLSDHEINPLKILILFFSMTFLSITLDEIGLFKYLACQATKIGRSNQFSLFLILYVFVSILTVFTSNDIVILTFTPFICYFCKNAKINPIPYLISEFAAANTWSMMLIIGNPTNIYLATSHSIDFISYLKVMFLPTIVAGICELLIIILLFKKSLKSAISIEVSSSKITDKVSLIVSLIHLSACIILLVISSYLSLQMWLISLVCASSLLIYIIIMSIIKKDGALLKGSLKRLPYELVPFMLSMFTIVTCLRYYEISDHIAMLLNNDYPLFTYGYSSFIACNLINNIPMSVLFASLPMESLSSIQALQATYATIIGSNIGAFLTPIGALAGIMFTQLTKEYEVKYSFKDFMKYGAIISIPTLSIALLMLLIVL